jgi:di/tricarboxylate transporter
MLVTSVLGMWISNTACALTMVPNVLAIVSKLEEIAGDPRAIAPFAKCLFLAIPYCCSVGGFMTLIGTPPNLILAQISRERFPRAPEIGFGQFMFVAVPTSIIIQIFMYFYYYFVFLRKLQIPPGMDTTLFKENYAKLGPWKAAEKWVLLLFAALALLWFFRGDLNFGGSATVIGWSNRLFDKGSKSISDGTVAILLSCLLFIIHVRQPSRHEEEQMEGREIDLEIRPPARRRRTPSSDTEDIEDVSEDSELREERSEVVHREEPPAEPREDSHRQRERKEWVPILDWNYVQQKIPWSILFLFAGGFVLNLGFQTSGLDKWLGNAMRAWTRMPLAGLLMLIMLITTVFSTFASNTACANIILPIVAVLAQNGEIHPWRLMFPACFMTSCCFLLPVSTPPNLIAYGSGRLAMKDFIIHGAVFTVVSLLVVWGMSLALMPAVFGAKEFPDWAAP